MIMKQNLKGWKKIGVVIVTPIAVLSMTGCQDPVDVCLKEKMAAWDKNPDNRPREEVRNVSWGECAIPELQKEANSRLEGF